MPRKENDQVTAVAEGDLVEFPADGPYQLVPAKPTCDQNTGQWYCASHRKAFANQFQKDTHIESGKHRLAWVCAQHGPEVP